VTDRPDVDLSLLGDRNFDHDKNVVRSCELKPRDVFEHPYNGELTLVEANHPGDGPGKTVLTVVPYSDVAAQPSELTLDWNLPVQTFPPVASAHANLGADLSAGRVQLPTQPARVPHQ